MTDEYAIQQVINHYSQVASLLEWDAVLELFQPDAVWEIPFLGARHEGHDQLRKALTDFASWMEYVLQANSPAVIKVDGDSATARSGIREVGKFKGRDEGFEFIGMYVDRLVRTTGGWKFAHRSFEHMGTNCYKLVPVPA